MSYRLGRLNGEFVITWQQDGKRRRYRLGTRDKAQADRIAPSVYAEVTKPRGKDVQALWQAYTADRAGRAVLATMHHTWKALQAQFGNLPADAITVADCRAHATRRRLAGTGEGTIHTELGHLRTVLRWAWKQGLIDKAPHIERPAKPRPKERHLTREQARALIDNAAMPHIRLFIILALATGARSAALLDLTWSRCDFEAGMIDLRNPDLNRPHKGRAIVPMNRTLRAALVEAKKGALSDHVIEWAGKPVHSVKRGLAYASKEAGLGKVSPHLLRHSAAVHMAEKGIPMEEIAQYLGHSNSRITRDVYARFSPTHLRKAAEALEYDDLAERRRKA